MKLLQIIVTGYVQGVGYRAFIYTIAKSLELQGYVQNLPGGTVKIVALGTEYQLEKLIEYAKEGPILSRVNNVIVQNLNTLENFNCFEIR